MRRILILTILCLNILIITAQEATKWRGPQGNGIYPDINLLQSWPDEGPEILWHFDELGQGFSSPVCANGKIYLTGMLGSTGYLFILTDEGKLLNKYPYGKEFSTSYPGSRSSPAITGELAYMYSGLGKLVCMNAGDGTVIWSKEMFSDFDGRNTEWGVAETPVIDGDVVYCCPGGKNYNVIALDRHSGKLIWKSSGKGEIPAYNTPLLVDLPQGKLLVTMMASHTLGIAAGTGELIWTQHQPNTYSVHANTAIYFDGGLYCTSGYGRGGFKLELTGDGSVAEKAWTNKSLDSRMGGAVLVDGYLYGSGDSDRSWKCLDWKTGKQTYSSTEIGNGVVISADGLLFCYSQRGELAFVKASPEQFELRGKTRVTMGSGQHWAHPVISKGRLLVRHGDVLIAYNISE